MRKRKSVKKKLAPLDMGSVVTAYSASQISFLELGGSSDLRVCSLSIEEAEEFLEGHGRHYKTPAAPICAIGVKGKELHGAAILGRRADGDGELAHIYVDGISQGYSLLYGACWRALKALGYEKAAL